MLYDRDYWAKESLRYIEPHYRLLKTANIINALSHGQTCDLLDVGCGPATLSKYLHQNIQYYGLDLFIHEPAPNLMQADLLRHEIRFQNRQFDLICTFGFFEYMGNLQHQKMSEIDKILKPTGTFITSFYNFRHRNPLPAAAYDNKISIADFLGDLKSLFHVNRMFPTSYNWVGSEPRRNWFKRMQMPWEVNLPLLNNALGVEFIFICTKRN